MYLLRQDDIWAGTTWIPSAFIFSFHLDLSLTQLARVWEKKLSAECCSRAACTYAQDSVLLQLQEDFIIKSWNILGWKGP